MINFCRILNKNFCLILIVNTISILAIAAIRRLHLFCVVSDEFPIFEGLPRKLGFYGDFNLLWL